jgi:predicted nucleic acid-binding protein
MISVDSSSLILLAKASVLETLSSVNVIVIGRMVYDESAVMGKELGKADSLLIERLVSEKRIIVMEAPIKEKSLLSHAYGIKGGENETVALALSTGCRKVLTDDHKNMAVCKTLDIPFMISLDAIIELYENERIPLSKAKEAFERVVENGWMREELVKVRRNRLFFKNSK